tara:strand:+ start:13905 stop:14798 length:894 start_codon:yes stop_codon:yes gene_type:complete
MIETRLLRSFTVVAEELHFGRAARRLSIAQPALTRQIQQLEERLSVALFTRSQRRVTLTASGRIFLQRAREILNQIEEAGAEARRVEAGQEGIVRVGFIHSSTYGITPTIIRRFRNRYPSVVLDLHEMPIDEQVAALIGGTIDVGILRPPLADPRLTSKVLVSECFVIALPDSHPLSTRASVPLSAVASETFIFFTQERSPLLYQTINAMCQEAGFAPRVEQHATQIHTMLGLVAAGLGIAIVPEVARKLKLPNVTFCEIGDDSRTVDVALGWRITDDSPAVSAFVSTTAAGDLGEV